MIKRIVKMSFRPGEVENFKHIYKTYWEQIKSSNGCSHVELLQDENMPSVFFTYSHWQSEDDLNTYRNSELFGKVWGSIKPFFNDKPQAWTVKELKF